MSSALGVIRGLDRLSRAQLLEECRNGARFVRFSYCFSLLVVAIKRESPVFLVRAGENPRRYGSQYDLISALLGWWGFPFGPIWTLACLGANSRGGTDVTDAVLRDLGITKDHLHVEPNEWPTTGATLPPMERPLRPSPQRSARPSSRRRPPAT